MEDNYSEDVSLDNKENNLKEFEAWRNQKINHFNEDTENADLNKVQSETYRKFLDEFPKCMVQMTKQMCNCDQDCLGESFRNIYINTVGLNLDRSNLYLSTKHVDCDSHDKKIFDGKMYNLYELSAPLSKITEDIQDQIISLCGNENESLNKLQCKAYELKDFCKEDYNCYKQSLLFSIPENCSNTELTKQLKDMESSIGFPELGLSIEDLQPKGRKVRSVENNNFQGTFEQENTSDPSLLTSSSDQATTSDIATPTICIGGIMLMSIFGFLTFKLFKKISNNRKSETEGKNDLGV